MTRMRYRIGERTGPRPRSIGARRGRIGPFAWQKRRKMGPAVAALRDQVQADGGPYAVRFEEAHHRFVAKPSAESVIRAVAERAQSRKFKVGERLYVRTGRRVLALQELWPSVKLPAGSERWSKASKRVYRFVMWRPGWEWWGGQVCRKNRRNTRCWSEHSWPGVHDFHPPSMKKGDAVFPKLRKRFGWTVIWREELHFDHAHCQPRRSHPCGTLPPCAKRRR